ncbi:MAG: cytochrome c family protein [Spirochaetes bacterium]|nr:cytochrome c family protein [Spirochaetota bacterium]
MLTKRFYILVILLCIPLIAARQTATFVGVAICKKCHESDAIGNQYKSWQQSPHSKAYLLLKQEKALALAKALSIENPAFHEQCVKCHTTGSGKNPAIYEDGVGCESCHGPGSIYNSYENHVALGNRDVAYKKAVSLGMYPILGTDGIKAREKVCRSCHNEKRPCYPKDPAEQQHQYLPLQLIADFAFPHRLRR